MWKLWTIFEEVQDGNFSMMRFLNFMLVVVPLLVWAIISLFSWTLVTIPESIVILMIAGLTGKVAQRYLEGKQNAVEVNQGNASDK
jgi:hypothetical protein